MRKIRKPTLTLLLALSLVVVSVVPALADISTDKPDYNPGETVTISGDEFAARETVNITVNAPYGTVTGDAKADRSGAFTWSFVLPADDSAEGHYSYSARGEKSGTVQAATFTDHGAGSPADCITDNDPDTSFQENPDGGEITATAAAGNEVEAVCIKSGNGTFALAGSGSGANSETGPAGSNTSAHSIVITADGTYGLGGCYTVSGIGTDEVTISITEGATLPDGGACKDLSHGDIFTEDENGNGEVEFEKTTTCPDEIAIYQVGATVCSFTITFSTDPATDVDLIIVDTVPAEWEVTGLDPSVGMAKSEQQGNQMKGDTLIEWSLPADTTSATLVVEIATREGGGGRNSVFKPTSCGPLPINEGAEAFVDNVVIGTYEPATDIPSVAGPTNSLESEAVSVEGESNQPCQVGDGESGLVVTGITTTTVSLSWTANPEDDGMDQGNLLYYVYECDERRPIATVTGGTTFIVTGLTPDTAFCFQVNAAFTAEPDKDGNHSNQVNGTTDPPPLV